jgi:hypothetical protein
MVEEALDLLLLLIKRAEDEVTDEDRAQGMDKILDIDREAKACTAPLATPHERIGCVADGDLPRTIANPGERLATNEEPHTVHMSIRRVVLLPHVGIVEISEEEVLIEGGEEGAVAEDEGTRHERGMEK